MAKEPKQKRLPKKERLKREYDNSSEKVLESTWFGNPDDRQSAAYRKDWPSRIKHVGWDLDEPEETTTWRGPNHQNHLSHGQ